MIRIRRLTHFRNRGFPFRVIVVVTVLSFVLYLAMSGSQTNRVGRLNILQKDWQAYLRRAARERDPKTDEPEVVYGHDACGKDKIYLLNLVHSAVTHVEKRQTIRDTWGGMKKYRNLRFHTVFIVGQTPDKTLGEKLEAENKQYGDIVKGDFLDTYRNLTTKMIFWLRWLDVYCRQAEYILKCDDDMVINPDKAVWFIEGLAPEKREVFYVGHEMPGMGPYRDPGTNWYVSLKQWPGKGYPLYHSGRALMMTKKATSMFRQSVLNGAADKKYKTSWKIFGIDDVYLGALSDVSGITPMPGSKMFQTGIDPKCEKGNCSLSLTKIAWYVGDVQKMRNIWTFSRGQLTGLAKQVAMGGI